MHLQGSVSLRQLAHTHAAMMVFGRVVLGKDKHSMGKDDEQRQTAAWARIMRVTEQELVAPCIVLLRGPGAAPELFHIQHGTTELEKKLNEKGLMWQASLAPPFPSLPPGGAHERCKHVLHPSRSLLCKLQPF
jgi:hypothetical protein